MIKGDLTELFHPNGTVTAYGPSVRIEPRKDGKGYVVQTQASASKHSRRYYWAPTYEAALERVLHFQRTH